MAVGEKNSKPLKRPALASPLDVTVIIPTFCEAANLPVLVPKVITALKAANLQGEVLVVDDNSPDDTAAICTKLAVDHPVRLETRKTERGLSSAVIHGMNHARGAILVVMDADLSHPPEKIAELVAQLRTGDADFVIGSRYVCGGGTDAAWGIFRWMNSKVATMLARPLTSVNDPMAGFFAIRAEDFRKANTLDPIGYKIGLELLVKCDCRHVVEVPIQFHDRLHGESKLTLREQFNYLRHLKRLYDFKLGHLSRSAQFVTVGATGMLVDFVSYALLLLVLPMGVARALAIWTAMTWNYWGNRRITFADSNNRPFFRQYAVFCLSCMVGGLVNWSVSVFLSNSIPFFDQHKLLAAFLGVVAGTAFNYVLSCRVVFR